MIKAVKQKCLSGCVIDVAVKAKSGDHTGKRSERQMITPEAVRKNNVRNSKKNLARTINANFTRGDLHVTLTYDNDNVVYTEEEAEKAFKNFIRKLKRRFDSELKYVGVTEGKTSGKRFHHHVILNCRDVELIEKLWDRGYIRVSTLDASGDYTRLAEYLLKEQEDKRGVHKYHASRNLIRPIVKEVDADIEEIEADPIPDKGYYIPAESIRRFEHPVTGLPILEYRMVKLEGEKGKKFLKGKKVKTKESYKPTYEEEQLGFESLDWEMFGDFEL